MDSPRLLHINVILAALTFNNWLLGSIFNQRLFNHWGTISELSAPGQPHAALFRGLDVLSGLLFILLALQLFRQLNYKNIFAKIALIFMAVLGLANIGDALMPLKCAPSLQGACGERVNLSLSNLQLPSHLLTSTLIVVSFFVLPLVGYFYAKRCSLKTLQAGSLAALAVMLASLAFGAKDYFSSTGSIAPAQWLQMLTIGWWFILFKSGIAKTETAAELSQGALSDG